MADTIIRLKVESTEYEGKIKRAVQGMLQLEKHVREMGAGFEVAEKADLEFVRALGDMETQTQSVKGQMREFTEAILALKQQYDRLTDEEKFGEWGQAMMGSIDKLKVRAANLKDEMGDLDDEIKNMASDTLVFDQIAGAMGTMVSVFQVGQGVIQMFGIENENAVKAMAKLQGAMAVTQGLAQIQNALQKQSTTMMAVATLQKKALAAAEALDTAAKSKNVIVTKAATAAQSALNLVAKANPYVLLASAVIAVGAALWAFASKSEKAKKAEEDHQKALDKAKEKMKNYSDAIGSSIGGILASYQKLRAEWATLSTDQEKLDWIKNQNGEFNKLGISIGNITDAENVFVRNTENMVKALQLRAQAAALEKLATEEYEDYYQGMQEQGGIVSAGDSAGPYALQLSKYDRAYAEDWAIKPQRPEFYDDFAKDASGNYTYTAEGAERENTRRAEAAGVSITSGDSYIAQFLAAQQESKRLFEEMGVVIAGEVEPAVKNVANAAGDIAKNVEKAVYNAENIKFNKKGLSEVSKHFNDLFQNAEIGTDDYLLRAENLADLEEFERLLKLATEYGINTADITAFKESFDSLKTGLDIDDETWTTLEEKINEKLQEMGIKLPVELDVKTDGAETAKKEAQATGEAWSAAASAVQSVGGALQQIEDPGAKVAGIIAQAVANIALSYAEAAASPAVTGTGWGWLGFAAAGIATMISTISSIKQVTQGFADGGMVGGNSYSGDNIVARLNSGEGVLTAAGVRNAQAMASNANPMGGMQLEALVSGESLRLVLANNASRRGGNRGQYAITKFG